MQARRPGRGHRRLRRLHPLAEGLLEPRRRRLHALGEGDRPGRQHRPGRHSRSFTVDTAAPDTTITSGPSGLTNDASPSFDYSSSEPNGASFQCKLDGPGAATGAFADCTPSPKAYSNLADGAYTLSVKATDQAGNTGPTADSRSFTVDTAAPDTTITSGPSGLTNDASPSFDYSSSEPNSSFQCKLDGPGAATGGFADCTPSPKAYSNLADGTYTLSVKATDQAGNTGPAASRSFTVDTAAPDTTITSGPSGLTNDASPSFDYSSSEPTGASFQCKLDGPGAATGAFADCTPSPKAYSNLADGTYTLSVKATDQAGNTGPAADSRSFTVDTAAPDTTITSGPSGLTDDASPSFDYSSSEPSASFQCKLDGPGAATGAFADCTPSPKAYSNLADGTYTLSVKATDQAGNTDPTPDSRSFTVDTAAPDTTITSGPSGLTTDASPSFDYSSSEPTTPASSASSTARARPPAPSPTAPPRRRPTRTSPTAPTRFSVKATDQAGNTDPTADSRSFTVDTAAPDTTITSGPSGLTADASPSFDYSSSEPTGASFQCKLDGPGAATGAFADCTPSPKAYSNLADGTYTFSVKATDQAGNTDPTPDSRSFTVDTAAPDTTITSGPSGLTADASPSFDYSSSEPTGASFQCKLDGPGAATGASPTAPPRRRPTRTSPTAPTPSR